LQSERDGATLRFIYRCRFGTEMAIHSETARHRSRHDRDLRVYLTFWVGLLLLTLAAAGWAIFSRHGGKTILVEAAIEPQQRMFWKIGYPRLGGTIDATNLKPAHLSGQDFTFYGWGRAQFVLNIFAAVPLSGSRRSIFGSSEKILASDHMDLRSRDPLRLRVDYYFDAAWRSFEHSTGTVSLISYTPFSELPPEKRRDQVLQGVAWVTGKSGTRFDLITGQVSDCVPECSGSFADFAGHVYPSDPPQFRGPGADGVNRVVINAGEDTALGRKLSRAFDKSQGFLVFAATPSELDVQEFAEQVHLTANSGRFNFDGQTFLLDPSQPLRIQFDRAHPGQIRVSRADGVATARINGIAHEVQLGEEDLTPRRIDEWPWYVQMLFGIMLTLCVERLISILRLSDNALLRRVAKQDD
jgi:hypothetical protein